MTVIKIYLLKAIKSTIIHYCHEIIIVLHQDLIIT